MSSIRRRLNDWLSNYIKYTENSESPTSYHTWAGLSCLASALQRKVYLKWLHSTLYPNLYIILVGPSGRARKGEPITVAQKMMDSLGIPSIGEDNSRESVVRDLRNSLNNFTDSSTGKIMFHCSAYCFIEELAVFTGYQNTDFLATLTNWYDSRDHWRRGTKHQGRDEIDGVCFNLLAATAPDWLPHILPKEAVGGGFTSRVVFIVEERKGKTIASRHGIGVDHALEEKLKYDLEIISTLSGEFDLDKAADRFYESWYLQHSELCERGDHPFIGTELVNYLSRKQTLLRKLGMILSVSRSNELLISEGDLKRALALLDLAERKMNMVFKGIGRNRYVMETELVLDFMKAYGTISHSQILRMLMRQIDNQTLKQVMEGLNSMGLVESTRDKETGDIKYKLTNGAIERLH